MHLTGTDVDDFEDIRQIMTGPVEADALTDINDDLRRLINNHNLGQTSLSEIKSQLEVVADSALTSSQDWLRQYVDGANHLARQRPGQFLLASTQLNQWGYWFGMSQLGNKVAAVLVIKDQLVYAPLTKYQLYVDTAKLPTTEQAAIATYRHNHEI